MRTARRLARGHGRGARVKQHELPTVVACTSQNAISGTCRRVARSDRCLQGSGDQGTGFLGRVGAYIGERAGRPAPPRRLLAADAQAEAPGCRRRQLCLLHRAGACRSVGGLLASDEDQRSHRRRKTDTRARGMWKSSAARPNVPQTATRSDPHTPHNLPSLQVIWETRRQRFELPTLGSVDLAGAKDAGR